MQNALAAVAQSLEAGDATGALARAVDAWRAVPAVSLVTLCERLAERLPPLAADADVSALVAANDPRAVSLLRDVRGLRLDAAYARVAAFESWPADPRLGSAIIEHLETLPFTSDDSWSFWVPLFALAKRIEDPRFVPLAQRLPAKWKLRERMREPLVASLVSATKGVTARFPDGPPTLPSDLELEVQRLLSTLAPSASATRAQRTIEELLADVYAHPEDDAPRLVLADVLQERGDPRGELIALQCRKEPLGKAERARVAELLRAHGREWMGPLAAGVAQSEKAVFRRGFLASAYLTFKHVEEAERVGSEPAWATVEELGFGKHARMTEAMRHARVVRIGLDTADGQQTESLFVDGPPWAIEELTVDWSKNLLTTTRLPKLRLLRAPTHTLDEKLFDAPIAAHLEELETYVGEDTTTLVLDAGLRLPRLRALRLSYWNANWSLTLTRDDQGAFTEGTLTGVPDDPTLRDLLTRTRPRTLRVLDAPGDAHTALLEAAKSSGIGEVDLRESSGELHRFDGFVPPQRPPKKVVDVLDHAQGVAFSPSGQTLWIGVWQGVRRLDAKTLEAGEIVSQGPGVVRIAGRIVTFGSYSLRVLDGETGVASFEATANQTIHDASISPDGTTVVAGLDNGSVVFWNLETRAATKPWKLVPSCADDVALSPDGTRIAVGTRNGELTIASIPKHRAIHRSTPFPTALVFLSNERLAAVVREPESALVILSLPDCAVLARHPHPSYCLAIVPFGDTLYVAWGDGTVSAHDLVTLAERYRVDLGHDDIRDLDLSPDGTTLAVAKEYERRLVILDAKTGAVRAG